MEKSLPTFISAGEAKAILNNPDTIVVDARGGPDAARRFSDGHVAGALFLDLETDLSDKRLPPSQGGRHPLPDVTAFGRMLGKWGISPAATLLIYDDKGGANAAARFWWMMKALGHRKLQVVDGGWQALRQAGVPVEQGASRPLPSAPPYPAEKWLLPVAHIATVDRLRKEREWKVIDVRESYRYRGESEPIDLVAGHIPGAINAPYTQNLDEGGMFLSPPALAEHFRKILDDTPPAQTIVHCGSGVTACHTLMAMDAAGLEIPALYVGSWSEWSRNDKPVATGEQSSGNLAEV